MTRVRWVLGVCVAAMACSSPPSPCDDQTLDYGLRLNASPDMKPLAGVSLIAQACGDSDLHTATESASDQIAMGLAAYAMANPAPWSKLCSAAPDPALPEAVLRSCDFSTVGWDVGDVVSASEISVRAGHPPAYVPDLAARYVLAAIAVRELREHRPLHADAYAALMAP